MNVPVTIARNKLAASIATSIASNKVLDQENLGERIANVLTVGNMVPSEMIEQHRRQYPDVKLPSIDEVDEVLAEFLSNMIVVWEDKEGTIVFSLSEPIRLLSLEYRKNMGAKPVVVPVPEKDQADTEAKFIDQIFTFDELTVIRSKDNFRNAKTIEGVLVYLLGEVGWELSRISNELAEFWTISDNNLANVLQGLVNKKVLTLAKPSFDANPVWCLSDQFLTTVEERRQQRLAGKSKETYQPITDADLEAAIPTLADVHCVPGSGFISLVPADEREMLSNGINARRRISGSYVSELLQAAENVNDDTYVVGVLRMLEHGSISFPDLHAYIKDVDHSKSVIKDFYNNFVTEIECITNQGVVFYKMTDTFKELRAEYKRRLHEEAASKAVDPKVEYRSVTADALTNSELLKLTPAQIVATYMMHGAGITWNALVSLLEGVGMSEKILAENLKELSENEVVSLNPPDTLNPLVSFTSVFNEEMQKKKDEKLDATVSTVTTDGTPPVRNKSREVHARAANELRQEERMYRHQKSMSDEAAVRSTEPGKDDRGDTEYLMSSPANASRLLASKEQLMSAYKEANVDTEQLVSASRTAMAAHHEAYHAIAEETFGDVLDPKGIEAPPAKPEFILEFMGTKQTAAAARETYDDVMAILSKAEDNSMLVKLFPPGAFENLKQYVEQFDSLGTQF